MNCPGVVREDWGLRKKFGAHERSLLISSSARSSPNVGPILCQFFAIAGPRGAMDERVAPVQPVAHNPLSLLLGGDLVHSLEQAGAKQGVVFLGRQIPNL